MKKTIVNLRKKIHMEFCIQNIHHIHVCLKRKKLILRYWLIYTALTISPVLDKILPFRKIGIKAEKAGGSSRLFLSMTPTTPLPMTQSPFSPHTAQVAGQWAVLPLPSSSGSSCSSCTHWHLFSWHMLSLAGKREAQGRRKKPINPVIAQDLAYCGSQAGVHVFLPTLGLMCYLGFLHHLVFFQGLCWNAQRYLWGLYGCLSFLEDSKNTTVITSDCFACMLSPGLELGISDN